MVGSLFVRLFVRSFVCAFVCAFGLWVVCLCVCLCVCLFVCIEYTYQRIELLLLSSSSLLVGWLVRFRRLHVRSFVRSFVQSFLRWLAAIASLACSCVRATDVSWRVSELPACLLVGGWDGQFVRLFAVWLVGY